MGKTILDETLALMASEGAAGSMAVDPEYTAAVASLPRAEDLVSFFDMEAMLVSLHEMADQIVSMQVPAAGGGDSKVTNAYRTPEANQLNQQAVEAYRQGDYAKALELIRKAHDVDPGDSVVLYNLACFNAINGNPEKAIDWLEKAVAGGFNNPDLIGGDSDLDSIRENPRFDAALQQARSAVSGGSEEWKAMADQIVTMIFDVPSVLDHVVAIEFTEGHSTHMLTRAAMSADAKSKPIYEVFGHRPALANFDRFLPVETVSFAVDSGIDPSALYAFLESSVRSVGPQGEALLDEWAGMQEQMGLDVARDVFGWIEGESISASLGRGMSADWIMMAKVTDEELAHEKILAGLDALTAMIEDFEEAEGNPMIKMIIPEITPLEDERLPGFYSVAMGGQPAMIWGVTDGHLVLGSNDDSVMLCLETARGEHQSVRANEELMSRLIVPEGEFNSISYTDQRDLGQDISGILGAISMMGMMVPAMIPDPTGQKLAAKALGIVGKLSPVAAELDFFISTSSYTTFDGEAWVTHQVTHYLPYDM